MFVFFRFVSCVESRSFFRSMKLFRPVSGIHAVVSVRGRHTGTGSYFGTAVTTELLEPFTV